MISNNVINFMLTIPRTDELPTRSIQQGDPMAAEAVIRITNRQIQSGGDKHKCHRNTDNINTHMKSPNMNI